MTSYPIPDLPAGDWTVDDFAIWALDDCDAHELVVAPAVQGCRSDDEKLAVLTVMAASKDMLQALSALLALEISYDEHDDPEQHRAWQAAQQAYRKAVGQDNG